MLVPVTKLFQVTKSHFLLANYHSLGIMVLYRGQSLDFGFRNADCGIERLLRFLRLQQFQRL